MVLNLLQAVWSLNDMHASPQERQLRQSDKARSYHRAVLAHCERVGQLAGRLAAEVGYSADEAHAIDVAGQLHDIGKLLLPWNILLKRGRLSNAQRQQVQAHPTLGETLLRRHALPQLDHARTIARAHHERWDGGGYPDGLAGPAIPRVARIAALADVFDALTHTRPYKRTWSIDAALELIHGERGHHFDPELTDAFVALLQRLQAEHGSLDAFYAGR